MATSGRDKAIKVWKLYYFPKDFNDGCFEKMALSLNIPDAHYNDITTLKFTEKQ